MTQEENHKMRDRLLYLRGEIEKECISYGEIAELQSLAKYIDEDDVLLLEWANVPEYLHDLTKGELIELMTQYDSYIQLFPSTHESTDSPVCLSEFYDNEYQIMLEEGNK